MDADSARSFWAITAGIGVMLAGSAVMVAIADMVMQPKVCPTPPPATEYWAAETRLGPPDSVCAHWSEGYGTPSFNECRFPMRDHE